MSGATNIGPTKIASMGQLSEAEATLKLAIAWQIVFAAERAFWLVRWRYFVYL